MPNGSRNTTLFGIFFCLAAKVEVKETIFPVIRPQSEYYAKILIRCAILI